MSIKFIPAIQFCETIFDGTHESPKEDDCGAHKLITSKNIATGVVDQSAAYYISDVDYKSIQKRSAVHKNDVLFSMIGTIGNVCLVKDEPDYAIKNIGVFRCKTQEDAMWLYFYLQTDMAKSHIAKLMNGSIQKFLALNKLEQLPILQKPKNYNKLIDVLSSIDMQIQRNNDMVHKLQVLAQTTYSRWFNQFEFPNEHGMPYKSSGGKMVWTDELKREIPERWQVKSIGDLLTEEDKSKVQVGEAKSNSGSFPFFTSGDEILLYKDAFVNGPHCYLNTGGNADVKFFDGEASYSTDTWCISFNEYTYFVNELLQAIKPHFDKLYFSGSGLKHLQKESFKQLKLFIPDEKILEKYNAIVCDCYKQIASIYTENNRLQSLKNSILPILINGQLIV